MKLCGMGGMKRARR